VQEQEREKKNPRQARRGNVKKQGFMFLVGLEVADKANVRGSVGWGAFVKKNSYIFERHEKTQSLLFAQAGGGLFRRVFE